MLKLVQVLAKFPIEICGNNVSKQKNFSSLWMDSEAPNAPKLAPKRPSLEDLLEYFADDEEIANYIKWWLSTGPNGVETFSMLSENTFTAKLGNQKGKLLYNIAFPKNPEYNKIAIIESAILGSATRLRDLLEKIRAQDWTSDLTTAATKFVEKSSDFQKTFNCTPKKPPKNPSLEEDMYPHAKNFFKSTVSPLGLAYVPGDHGRKADKLYPDGRVVRVADVDISDYEHLVLKTILDVEIKRPWATLTHPTGNRPWHYLPSSGTSGSTPTSGLFAVMKRALDFLQNSTTTTDEPPTGISPTYSAVVCDLHKFVFFKMDREGQIWLTKPIEDIRTAMAMIWWICSKSLKASGFRDSAAKIYHRQIHTRCPSPSDTFVPGFLQDDSGIEWRLSELHWLGGGNHGSVFSCRQGGTATENDYLCLKVAPISNSGALMQLEFEDLHLDVLRRCDHVPKVIALGNVSIGFDEYRALLTDVVGVALPKLSSIELESILPNLWSEMLSAVREIHSHRVIHGDIKPDHFVMNQHGLWVIDFGSAFTSATRILRDGKLYTSTMFNSARVLSTGKWPNEEDDIQSTAYAFVALLSPGGVLPEDHQSDPGMLLTDIKPQHIELVKMALTDANIMKLPKQDQPQLQMLQK